MRELFCVGSALKEISDFPERDREEVMDDLFMVQGGETPPTAVPLKGYVGAKVMELKHSWNRNTYRTIYTGAFKDAVYVLCAFQKKSTQGKNVPKQIQSLINSRYKAVQRLAQDRAQEKRGSEQ